MLRDIAYMMVLSVKEWGKNARFKLGYVNL